MHNTGTRNRHKKLEENTERDQEKRRKMDSSCRVCGKAKENIFHIKGACPVLVPTMYLKSRHNQVAKIIYQEKMNLEKLIDPPEVTKIADAEMWWGKKVKTMTKIEHNRPDMIYWDKKNKQCEIIEISVPLDNYMQQAYRLKQGKYIELISQLENVLWIQIQCYNYHSWMLGGNPCKSGAEHTWTWNIKGQS